jgi:hypothetical protein
MTLTALLSDVRQLSRFAQADASRLGSEQAKQMTLVEYPQVLQEEMLSGVQRTLLLGCRSES